MVYCAAGGSQEPTRCRPPYQKAWTGGRPSSAATWLRQAASRDAGGRRMSGRKQDASREADAERTPSPHLRFGIWDWLDHNKRVEIADLYEQRLQMLEYADRVGFYGYHLAEHHGIPLSMSPSPNLFFVAVPQRTRRLRFGSMVYLLPFYNPLRLVEEVCMLDHFSRGRLDLGLGRPASPYEMA